MLRLHIIDTRHNRIEAKDKKQLPDQHTKIDIYLMHALMNLPG